MESRRGQKESSVIQPGRRPTAGSFMSPVHLLEVLQSLPYHVFGRCCLSTIGWLIGFCAMQFWGNLGLWEQIRSELRWPFISCLCSQRPDDPQEVLRDLKLWCDRDALSPSFQLSPCSQCLHKLEETCHYCSPLSFFNLNGNYIPRTWKDLASPSSLGMNTPLK
jgi:hypothetical protein